MKLYKIFFLSFLLLFSYGCKNDTEQGNVEEITNQKEVILPVEMPEDFHFTLKYGFYKKNEINTYDRTVTKDLIEDGTITAEIALTDEELAIIYEKMKAINIGKKKKLTPKTNCMMEPYTEDEWKISVNGEVIYYYFSDKYCEITDDAKQLAELRDEIVQIMKQKEAYQNLPEPIGGYD